PNVTVDGLLQTIEQQGAAPSGEARFGGRAVGRRSAPSGRAGGPPETRPGPARLRPGEAREEAAAYAERGRATIHGGAGWIRGPHRGRSGPASADDGRQAVSARVRVGTGVAVRTPPPMRDSRW